MACQIGRVFLKRIPRALRRILKKLREGLGELNRSASLALKLAGVTRETQDLPGGTIVRDADGEPTGVLKDAAMNYVTKVIPNPIDRNMWERKIKAILCAFYFPLPHFLV
jgi:hypothetical protein